MIGEDELNALLAPSNQIYTGELNNNDPVSQELALLGQLNPVYSRRFAAQQGRFLSGFGDSTMQNEEQISDHADVSDMEAQDDVLGSGVFDPFRRPATVNNDLGVFGANYSIPGNHAREVPFTVNHEITDITSGAEIVGIPSGGLNYVEHGNALPYLDPTNRYEPYAKPGVGGKGWDPDSVLAPAETYDLAPRQPTSRGGARIPFRESADLGLRRPEMTAIPGRPARQPMFETSAIPAWPASQLAPMHPADRKVSQTPTVSPTAWNIAANTDAYARSRSAAPSVGSRMDSEQFMPVRGPLLAATPRLQAPLVVGNNMTSAAATFSSGRQATRGFGSSDEGSSSTTTLLALFGVGVVAGAALRMLMPKKGA